jgi:hypothetical protein
MSDKKRRERKKEYRKKKREGAFSSPRPLLSLRAILVIT